MAQIIDLNELVPQDIIIRYGSPAKDYKLPGDISTEMVFRLFEMRQALATVEGKTPGEIVGAMKGRFGDIEGELLKLFQQRDPKLTYLPFGIRAMGAVLAVVLGQLGLEVTEENPQKPASTPARPKRSPTVKSRRR